MVQLLWKTVWLLLKKLNVELPGNPKIPLLGVYPKELKAGIQTHLYTHVHSSVRQKMETTQMPIDR